MTKRSQTAWLVLLLAYSAFHFAVSGVQTPLASPNIRQVAHEIRPLNQFLADGRPVTLDDPRQYGPVFFFVMHPLLRLSGGQAWPLSRLLYALQLTTLVLAFVSCTKALLAWVRPRDPALPSIALVALLVVLWANFSPLYTIVATKAVEMWELCLIAAAMYASVRGRSAVSGACIAAAALIKILPGAYFLYFLIGDRRAFVSGCATLVLLLGISHVVYGPEMGVWYLPRIVSGGATNHPETAFGRHDNISIKNTIVKVLGRLKNPGEPSNVPEAFRGYLVEISEGRARLAGVIGNAAVLLLAAATIVGLLAGTAAAADVGATLWNWAFVSVMMLLISPAATFEYFVLALPAFSFVAVALVANPRLRSRPVVVTFAAALLLVANVLPRQAINRIFPIGMLLRWAGLTHLTLSEGYQYFEFPLAGLLSMAVCLIALRRAMNLASFETRAAVAGL